MTSILKDELNFGSQGQERKFWVRRIHAMSQTRGSEQPITTHWEKQVVDLQLSVCCPYVGPYGNGAIEGGEVGLGS